MVEERLDRWASPCDGPEKRAALVRWNSTYADATAQSAVRPPLVRNKEERLVMDNGTAQRSPQLVLRAKRRRGEQLFVEVASRIQVIVVVEPERRSVKLIRSGFSNNVHDRSGSTAVLRRELIGNQSEFRYHIRIVDGLNLACLQHGITILAVQHEVVRAYAHPVYRDRAASKTRAPLAGLKLADARRRKCEV